MTDFTPENVKWHKCLDIPIELIKFSDIPEGFPICVIFLRAYPYSEYLLTEHWSAKRYKRLGIDLYRCALNAEHIKALEVHHRTYKHKGFEPMEDLITLCNPCHTLYHSSIKASISATFPRS